MWYLSLITLKEESMLSVLGEKIPCRIFGPKWEEIWKGISRSHDEDLFCIFYSSSNAISVMNSRKMTDWLRSSTLGDLRSAGKPEGYRSLRRFRKRWGYIIETYNYELQDFGNTNVRRRVSRKDWTEISWTGKWLSAFITASVPWSLGRISVGWRL